MTAIDPNAFLKAVLRTHTSANPQQQQQQGGGSGSPAVPSVPAKILERSQSPSAMSVDRGNDPSQDTKMSAPMEGIVDARELISGGGEGIVGRARRHRSRSRSRSPQQRRRESRDDRDSRRRRDERSGERGVVSRRRHRDDSRSPSPYSGGRRSRGTESRRSRSRSRSRSRKHYESRRDRRRSSRSRSYERRRRSRSRNRDDRRERRDRSPLPPHSRVASPAPPPPAVGVDAAVGAPRDRALSPPPRDRAPPPSYSDRYSRRSDGRDSRDGGRRDYRDYRGGDHRDYRGRGDRDRDFRGGSNRDRSRSPIPTIPPIASLEHELERLNRTVGVLQLPARLRSRELKAFFDEHVGEVRDAQIVKDHRTGVSKGIGYVEFASFDSVEKALKITGTRIQGMPCIVQTTEAEIRLLEQQAATGTLNLASSTTTPAPNSVGGITPEIANRRIYVGSLAFSLTDEDIRSIFEPFGFIEYCKIHRDPNTGESKGFAFVQYRKPEEARRAYEEMNGFDLVGRKIRVGWVTADKSATYANMGPSPFNNRPQAPKEDRLEEVENLGAIHMSRAELMKRLAREDDGLTPHTSAETTGAAQSASMATSAPVPPPIPIECPMRNCVLKNMFDPREETEPTWAEDIKTDVAEECSQFGKVLAIHVDKEHPEGHVYLRFDSVEACERAVKALNGRWFAKKQIVAQYIADAIFDARS